MLSAQIAAGTPIDVRHAQALQLDSRTALVDTLVPALLAAPVKDAFTRQAVDLLDGWDGRMTADSPAAAYLAAVWDVLLHATFADDLPESQWPDGSRPLVRGGRRAAQPAGQPLVGRPHHRQRGGEP